MAPNISGGNVKISYIIFFILFVNTPILLANRIQSNRAIPEKITSQEFLPKFIDEIEPFTLDAKKEIIFGQSGMFSGHFHHYGKAIRDGINAAFKKINEQGGINGKILRLVSLEDYGNPLTALKNVEYLLHQHKITLFIGNMGTRSILNLIPLLEQKSIALLFPWGGDKQLYRPELRTVINGPGLLEPQLDALVNFAKKQLKITKVSIFHSDDSFSTHAAQLLTNRLASEGITPVGTQSYNRFTLDIKSPAKILTQADPKLVFCISTSLPTVKLINYFFSQGHFGTTFLGVDSTAFVSHMVAPRGVKFYYSSCVPSPWSDLPIAQNYRRDIENLIHDQAFNIISFEYYLAAKTIAQAIKSIQSPYTHMAIMNSFESIKQQDMNGITVSFNPENRHIFGESVSVIQD